MQKKINAVVKKPESGVFNEAEAGLWLDPRMRSVLKMTCPLAEDFLVRIIQEWFEARRAVGIQPYSNETLVNKIIELRGNHA